MTYAKKTLSDLKQSLADRHDSGTLPTDTPTLTFWTRLLNRGVAYCVDRLRLVKSTSLTTSSGTIALPDDFIIIDQVLNDEDAPLSQIDQTDSKLLDGGLYFWITGNHDTGFYLNTYDDDTYTVYYSYRPADMSNDSDECVIPDPEAVVAYAYAYLRKSETDPIGDADSALQECDNRLAELQSANTINNNFTGFTLQDNA